MDYMIAEDPICTPSSIPFDFWGHRGWPGEEMGFWEAKARAGSPDLRPWGNGALRLKQLQKLESMQDSSETKRQQSVQTAGAHKEARGGYGGWDTY